MTAILSKAPPALDISAAAFRRVAGDVGEVIALMAGGVRPDAETLARLCLSLRSLQGFLIEEAGQQAAREMLEQAIIAMGATTVPADGGGFFARAIPPGTPLVVRAWEAT